MYHTFKKVLAAMLMLLYMGIFCSCGESGYTETTQTGTEIQSTATIHNIYSQFVETPTRLLYLDAGYLYYYNKLDGENYYFCFDPLCKHNEECISAKFEKMDFFRPIRYCAENNRFYAIMGTDFVSMSFDASDLKILHSFGNENALNDRVYGTNMLKYLELYDGYAYMTVEDANTGDRKLYRYDFKTETMINLMENSEIIDHMDYFTINDEKIYFWAASDDNVAFYQADINLNNIQKLSDQFTGNYNTCIFDEDKIYMMRDTRKLINSKSTIVSDAIVYYDLETNKENILCTLNYDVRATLHSVTSQYIYYTVQEDIFLGYQELRYSGPKAVYNQYPRVYRYDYQTGNVTVVLDDVLSETRYMYLSEDYVMIKGKLFEIDEDGAVDHDGNCIILADIDENGMFINLRELKEP